MKILFVETDQKNLSLFSSFFSSPDHHFAAAADAASAFEAAAGEPPDIVLVSTALPGTSAFAAVQQFKTKGDTPVVLVGAIREKEDVLQGLRCGADDFLFKPFVREEVLLKIGNVLRLRGAPDLSANAGDERARRLKESLGKAAALNRELVLRLLAAAEYKDDSSGKHILRVGKTSRIIADQLGIRGEYLELIESAAAMHDIGKIGIPDRMLLKAGKLNPKEFEIVKTHTIIGASILEGSSFPLLNMAYDIALSHHEKWNGTGYPDEKRGKAIPLSGRIVAVADVFDALVSLRPYKPAYSWDKSIIIIREGSGLYFDPSVVAAFLNKIFEIDIIYREFLDQEIKGVNTVPFDIERIR